MKFSLPIENGLINDVIGTISYRLNFTDSYFIHGTVPPVEGISLVSGTFSAGVYDNVISANIQYPGNIQFELRPVSIFQDGINNPNLLNRVNMTEKYYSKEMNDFDFMRKKLRGSFYKNRGVQERDNYISKKYIRSESLSSGTARLKILVLYTKQVVNACPGENCILSQITLAIGNYNVALKNSLVDMTVDYVAERIQEYDTYIENADMGNIFSQLGSVISTDRRYLLGCHAVHITTTNSQYCGLGSYAFNGQTNGYSVSFYGCIGGYMSLAHEVGHNIGLQHDTSGYSGNTPNRGYCWDDALGTSNCHRSIMSYAGCKTPAGKTNCDRV